MEKWARKISTVFLEDFLDLLNAMETSIARMKMQIVKLVGAAEEKPKQKWNWNPDKIR